MQGTPPHEGYRLVAQALEDIRATRQRLGIRRNAFRARAICAQTSSAKGLR
jgi:hypothetical protein